MARKNKKSNAVAVAMRKRYPRKQVMTGRAKKRVKDYKKSWRKDWNC